MAKKSSTSSGSPDPKAVDKEVSVVASNPLPCRQFRDDLGVLERRGEERLGFRASRSLWPIFWLLFLAAVGVLVLNGVLSSEEDFWKRMRGLGSMLAIPLVGILLLPWVLFPSIRFDRGSGQMTFGVYGFRRRRPLSDIVALQLCPGPVRPGRAKEGNNRGTDLIGIALELALGALLEYLIGLRYHAGPYQTFQLNLILCDAHQPRVHLANYTNLLVAEPGADRARQAAKQLADFLQVPLQDEI